MSKYSTKGKEVKEGGVSKWITPESAVIAKVCDVEGFETGKGSKGVKVTFMTKPVEGLVEHKFGTGQIAEATWWLTEKAEPYTIEKLILMADKLDVRDNLDRAMDSVKNSDDLVEAIKSVFLGIAGAFLFGGEEVLLTGDDGKENIWVKPKLEFYGFVRPLSELHELQERCAKLKADNKLITRLDKANTTATTSSDNATESYSSGEDW